jgi:hypothetical protein
MPNIYIYEWQEALHGTRCVCLCKRTQKDSQLDSKVTDILKNVISDKDAQALRELLLQVFVKK